MASTDLPVTGKDAKIVLTVGGVLQTIANAVVSHSAEPIINVVQTKPLGTSRVKKDAEYQGWKGEVEANNETSTIDEILDALDAASRTRAIIVVNLTETTYYRNGTSSTYTYPNITIMNAPRSVKREEASTYRLSWETGEARIPA